MNQERSVLEQAKSGMRLAATLLAAILVLSLLVAGLHSFSLAQRLGLGVVEVLIALGLLFATVGRWAKWFFAACCGNFLRLLGMAALGRTISTPSMAAPRASFLMLAGLMAIMGFLTYKFADTRPSRFDSVCLVGALVALVYSLLSLTPVRWVLLAVCFLVASWAHHHFARSRGRGQQLQ